MSYLSLTSKCNQFCSAGKEKCKQTDKVYWIAME
jgi:hypothetical protein